MGYEKKDFGENFVWGTSTSAYQIEGAHNIDGRGPSVWDHFSHQKGKIKNNENGDKACDFYHRYESDISLMASLNVDAFRFSLSWSRIFPEGIGKPNQKGIDFYHQVIDTCLASGIQPWITLYHWDLPLALEERGGWINRDIIYWFSEYVNFCTKTYGDKVKHWMVLNEPLAFTGMGYLRGLHAPGKKGIRQGLSTIHHAVLCQAEGGRIVRRNVPDAQIGTTFSCSYVEPYTRYPRDEQAAQKLDALYNRLFLEPALGQGYPLEDLSFLQKIENYFHPEDEKNMVFDFDFIGLQNYTREIASHSWLAPPLWAKAVPAEKRKVPITTMKWEVYPPGIYHLLKKFSAYDKVKKIYITENGASFEDKVEGEEVLDERRVKFLQSYIGQVLRAKKEGVKVEGYFAWSLLDNFEWENGYRPRFGLIHVDFTTQKRIIKNSGLWYQNFLGQSV